MKPFLSVVFALLQLTLGSVQATPAISISSPVNNSALGPAPTSFTVSATASNCVRVEFYLNGILIGSDTTTSDGYSLILSQMPAGSYTLTAKAIDGDNIAATSNAVAVCVGSSRPVIHWKLDEPMPPIALDASGNGLDGTHLSSTTTDEGDSITCNGTTTSGVIRQNLTAFPSTAITACFWIKTSDTIRDGTPISYAVTGKDNEFTLYSDRNFQIYIKNNPITTNVSVNDGKWHHIAVTWQSSDGRVFLYKDGTQAYTGTLAGGSLTSGGCLVVGQEQDSVGGGFSANQSINGNVRDVRIYNRVLGVTELSSIISTTRPPILYWKLSEGSGTSASDWSGNGLVGSLLAGTCWDTSGGITCSGTITSGILLNGITTFPTTALSTTFWIKTLDTTRDGTPISYAVAGNSNEFTIFNDRSFQIYIKGNSLSTNIAANDDQWHHIAVTWQSTDGKTILYKDGVKAYSGTLNGSALTTGGCLVVGQEQDSVGGNFDSYQAVNGALDKVRLYNRVLTEDEVAALAGAHFTSSDIAISDTTASLVLQNKELTLTLDKTRNGALTSMVNRATSTDYLLPGSSAAPLFTMDLINSSGTVSQTLVSRNATTCTISSQLSGSVGTAQLVYQFASPAVTVTCSAFIYRNDPLVHWRLACQLPGSVTLGTVRFPLFTLKVPTATDSAVVGSNGGGIYRPSTMTTYSCVEWQQPGNLAAQFGSYYNDNGGVYLAAQDAKGYPKSIELYRSYYGMELRMKQQCYETALYTPDYDIVLGTFRRNDGTVTTWRDAADRYKSWASQQHWCTTLYEQRADAPSWMKSGAGFVQFDRTWLSTPSSVTNWVANYWNYYFPNIPLITGFWGWEKIATWVGPDYFPAYPSDSAFTTLISDLRSQGCHIHVSPSSYNWSLTYHEITPDVFEWDGIDWFENVASSHAIRDILGNVRLCEPTWLLGGQCASVCPGDNWTPSWWNNDICLSLSDRGCELISMDQLVGGRFAPCYSSTHGHPRGPGKWMTEVLTQQLISMRAACSAVESGSIVCFEEPNEHYIDRVGIQDYRNCEYGGEWADVFNYLYHEYVPTFQTGLRDNLAWTAHCIVNGQMPRLYPVKNGVPANQTLFSNWVTLYHGTGKPYLLFGRMLHPPVFTSQVPQVRLAPTSTTDLRTVPAVMSNAFRASDGTEGVVLANASSTSQTVTFTWRGVPTQATLLQGEVKLYTYPAQ